MNTHKQLIDISVIITTHAESILIHRTIASVKRALRVLPKKYLSEIILHADNPTTETLDYIQQHSQSTLKDVRIFQNAFKDLGSSRNFSIQQAQGKYVATIDADDLMSENWLKSALNYLEQQTEPTVAHSEVTVEFEGADSLVIKHGEINFATDALLSVYANRWNSVIVAPRELLLEEPYTANSPGYGYEDWNLNCRLIARGVHNVLIPETAIFVRRKKSNSEWQRQIQSMAVLRANPLLAFKTIRNLTNPFPQYSSTITDHPIKPRDLRMYAKKLIKQYPLTHKIAKRVKIALKRQEISLHTPVRVPEWLQKEWRQLHTIDRQIFPSTHLMKTIQLYDTLTEDHKKAGSLYKTIVDKLHHDTYDYLIFVPWLIKGGADQYSINYANTISKLHPHKNVLVVSTLPVSSVWSERLSDDVDFLDFGMITHEASPEMKYRLMEHVIENAHIGHIHIINSEFGYDFTRLHESYIKASNKKVIVTSFSQSVDKEGRLYGYSHTHVPFVYDIASYITSDNQTVLSMWENEYGFGSAKMAVHRQAIALPDTSPHRPQQRTPLRVLWAARIAPEKQPELLATIGALTSGKAVIEVYGTIEPGCEQFIQNLPSNVSYKGNFDGFSSLPLEDYDTLLYTSLFDGMPNTILDGAQYKLPMIASAVGGIPEFIIDNETGLLVTDVHNPQAYADAIRRLSNDKSLGPKVSQGAYNKLKSDFSPIAYEESIKSMLTKLDY